MFGKKKKPKTALKAKSSFEKKKLVGALLILVAAALAFVVIPATVKAEGNTATVVVAFKNVAKGDLITESDVKMETRGVYGTKDYFEDSKKVVGQMAATELVAGDIVTKNKLGKENISKLEQMLNDGKTLTTVTVKTNAAGLASHLRPGDHVRVYYATENEYAGSDIIQNPVLDRVEVYDVENSTTQSVDKARKTSEGSAETVVTTITLVTTSKAQETALLTAEYNGNVHVVFVK